MKFPGVFFQDYAQASEVNPPNGSKNKLQSVMEKNQVYFPASAVFFPRAHDRMGCILAVTEKLWGELGFVASPTFFRGSP